MTMMDGTVKLYTGNNLNLKFNNQYQQWRVSKIQGFQFLETSYHVIM